MPDFLPIKDRTAVVGIGQTTLGKGLEDTELSLACQAISLAIDDAGLSPADVDGLAMFSMEDGREVDVARNVGLGDITFFSPGRLRRRRGLRRGRAGRDGGRDRPVPRSRSRGGPGSAPSKTSRPWAQVSERIAGHQQWSRPFGVLRPVDEIAMLTRRAMHEYGYTRDHLANVALAFRKHAKRNPNATMGHKPLTREQYMDARWISEPLCLFDNCLETDGALAVVITSAERARDLRQPPVLHPLVRAEHPAAAPGDDQLLQRRPVARPVVGLRRPAVAPVGPAAGGRAGRAALRRLQPARPAVARGLRVLRSRRGRRVHRGRRARVAQRPAPDQHRRAAGCPRPTCTASTWCSRACGSAAARPPRQVEGAGSCLVTSGEGVPTSAVLFRR